MLDGLKKRDHVFFKFGTIPPLTRYRVFEVEIVSKTKDGQFICESTDDFSFVMKLPQGEIFDNKKEAKEEARLRSIEMSLDLIKERFGSDKGSNEKNEMSDSEESLYFIVVFVLVIGVLGGFFYIINWLF